MDTISTMDFVTNALKSVSIAITIKNAYFVLIITPVSSVLPQMELKQDVLSCHRNKKIIV